MESSRRSVSALLPQIAIKKEHSNSAIMDELQIALVNGCWDTSARIPNIVAEMQNVDAAEMMLRSASPRSSDSGIEADCSDANLSWLLNYKINDILPGHDPLDVGVAPGSQEKNIAECSVVIEGEGAPPYRYSDPKKPPFTYTELIEHALGEKGELTVSGIYQWISEHFPFYKQNDDRWKNSVRHNLSINPHFRKGGKAIHGAGHLWTIAQKDDKKSWQIKQRMQQFIQSSKESKTKAMDLELEAATASILNYPMEKTIQVEFVNLVPNGLEDFLSPPVSKQQLVQECGLGNDFLITDLNPNALGLNLTEAEVMADEMYHDISLDYYELQKES